jgi:hypothetical protein
VRAEGGMLGPYRSLNGLSINGFFGRAQSQRRARGKSFTQSRCNSRDNLVRVFFKVQLAHSTLPEDWGW